MSINLLLQTKQTALLKESQQLTKVTSLHVPWNKLMLRLLRELASVGCVSSVIFKNLLHLNFLGETSLGVRELYHVLCCGRVEGCTVLAELLVC